MVNTTGLEVVHLCDGRRTIPQIVAAAAQRWKQDSTLVRRDVEASLKSLRRAGFLNDPLVPSLPAERAGVGTPGGRAWRLHVYLTERCNLRCRHCAVVNGSRPADKLNGETVRRLIDQAAESSADGIAFSGGEPLLRDDLLDLLEYAAGRVKTLLSTNGTLLDGSTAAALAEMGVIVQISLDGATAEVHDAIRGEGTFERAWRGIEALQRCGLGERLALNVTLMRNNVRQVPGILALAAERGVASVRFNALQRMGRAAELWSELAPSPEEYAEAYRFLYQRRSNNDVAVSPGLQGLELEPPKEGMWCGLGRMLLVDSQGDIYPCAMLTATDFRLGNVSTTLLVDALASEQLEKLIELCQRRKDEIETCQKCAWRHFCQGSCPASVWLQHGTFFAPDEFCGLRRELYQDLIFDQVERRQRLPHPRGIYGVPQAGELG